MLAPDPASSSTGSEINTLYWIALAIAATLVVIVNSGLIVMFLRGRSSRGKKPKPASGKRGSTLVVGGVLSAIAIAIFAVAVVYTGKAGVETSPASANDADAQMTSSDSGENLRILTSAQQWIWRYQYPDGTFSYYELVVPVGEPVTVDLESTDVLHRWWIPGLTQKADAVPGKTHTLTFTPEKTGEFEGASYIFSGANYATMKTMVRVVTQDEFDRWLDDQAAEITAAQTWVQDEIAKNGPYGAVQQAGSSR